MGAARALAGRRRQDSYGSRQQLPARAPLPTVSSSTLKCPSRAGWGHAAPAAAAAAAPPLVSAEGVHAAGPLHNARRAPCLRMATGTCKRGGCPVVACPPAAASAAQPVKPSSAAKGRAASVRQYVAVPL